MKYRTEGKNQGITVLALPKSMASAATRPAGLNAARHPAVNSFATEGENRPSTKDTFSEEAAQASNHRLQPPNQQAEKCLRKKECCRPCKTSEIHGPQHSRQTTERKTSTTPKSTTNKAEKARSTAVHPRPQPAEQTESREKQEITGTATAKRLMQVEQIGTVALYIETGGGKYPATALGVAAPHMKPARVKRRLPQARGMGANKSWP